MSSVHDLKRAFLNAYGHFADQRVKDIEKGSLFIVDDRSVGDYDAKRKLFYWFCQILIEIVDESTVKVTFRGRLPKSAGVSDWLTRHGAQQEAGGVHVVLHNGEQRELAELSQALLSIVKPGARYDEPAYKYVCPRTAASLRKLQSVLDGAWKS